MSDRGRRLEQSVPSQASSIDGRRVTLTTSLHDLQALPGSYLRVGDDRLVQVYGVEPDLVDPDWLDSDDSVGPRHVAVARGTGSVLDGSRTPFHAEPFVPAEAATVDTWLHSGPDDRAVLDVGTLARESSVRFPLNAAGFDRHTFFCGQSGSGKTYALGTVLERLLLQTSLRLVVLDPNSDFVRLGTPRANAPADIAAAYAAAGADVDVRRSGRDATSRLHVRFVDLAADEQAAALRLDPVADREEYGRLVDLVDTAQQSPRGDRDAKSVTAALLAADDPTTRALGARMRNLALDRWTIWSGNEEDSVQDLVRPGGPRALVVDLGSLATRDEQALAAESVLASLWRQRSAREPVLVVIDEAHNVCPRDPDDPVTALASETTARIAAEGRKFGIYLLISTQRPQRVNELVVSQCDNLVVMRMNATGDLAYLERVLSFAPRPLLDQATWFKQGEALVAGRITSHPALVRFGPRWSEEGGSDVPTDWAAVADRR